MMEMVKEYAIKAGDTLPRIEIEPLDRDGNPMDLAGYTAEITIAKEVGAARYLVKGSAGIEANKTIYYDWQPGQTLGQEGEYLLEVILKNGSGGQMTLPGAGYGKVFITPRL